MSLPVWTVVFAADAAQDLALIEEHLVEAYRSFGESTAEASSHAERRVDQIITSSERLALAPFRGEPHDDLLPGLRHLAFDQAVLWFQIDSSLQLVRVLAVFFGGQDHQRRILLRLLQPG
jgi:toxin ParE1/3/4